MLCYCRDSYISISGCNVCSSNFQYQFDALLGSFNIKGIRERALKHQLEKSYDKIRCIISFLSIYCINRSENTMDCGWSRLKGQFITKKKGSRVRAHNEYHKIVSLSSCIIFYCLYVLAQFWPFQDFL